MHERWGAGEGEIVVAEHCRPRRAFVGAAFNTSHTGQGLTNLSVWLVTVPMVAHQ